MRITNDERLVTLLRDGDAAAFEVIYDRHHRPILAFARHMLGDRHEAEDVVQHTFFAAYRDLTSNDRDYHVRAWLFTIARNRCLSLLRARRERIDLDEAEPSTDGLAAEIERRQELRALLGDLTRLPDEQREALLLTELSAMDHVAVASVLGVPKEKVKALVFQARTTLAADRAAREMSCDSIRERLATARGGELRRGLIRRHLRDCESCRGFRSAVADQRRAAAVILPVLPSAGLKASALSVIAGGSAGGGGTLGAGLVSALGAKGIASKGLVIAAIAGTGTAGVATVDALRTHDVSKAAGAQPHSSVLPPRKAPMTSLPTHHDAGSGAATRRLEPSARVRSSTGGAGRPDAHPRHSAEPGSMSTETARKLSRPAHGLTPPRTPAPSHPSPPQPTGESPPVSPYPASSAPVNYSAGTRQRMLLIANLQQLTSPSGAAMATPAPPASESPGTPADGAAPAPPTSP